MYSFQLTKNVVGIDIGSYSLKVVECQRAGEKITLLNYEVRRLPKPKGAGNALSQQEISAFIRETLKEIGIKTSDVVAEITGPWTVARHLFMTDLPDNEMREAIRWGAKSDFPFSLEEAIIDFHKIDVFKRDEGELEAEIIAAVATRQVVEEQVALLKEAGLKPLSFSIPSFDLMQVYRLSQPAPWSETVAIVELGHKSTQIIVLKEGSLKFSRDIAVAGDTFTQSLTGGYEINGQTVEVDDSQGEKIKFKVDLLEEWDSEDRIEGVPLDLIQKRLGPVVDRLILEVERSLNYYKTQFKDYEIKRVLLTGGGSLLKGLPSVLEKNLEIPVQTFQNAGLITLKKKINEELFLRNLPFLATVLGLVTPSHPLINLSPQYLAPQVKAVPYRKYLKPVLMGALSLGIVWFFGSPYWTASREIARLQKEVVVKKGQLARVGKPAEGLARFEKEEAELNKALEGVPKIKIDKLPVKDLFQELSRMVPANMTFTRFQFFKVQEVLERPEMKAGLPAAEATTAKTGEIESGVGKEDGKRDYQMVIEGIVFGSDQEIMATLSDFTRTLNRSQYFKEAKVQTTLKSKVYSKGAAEFKILARLGEGSTPTG